MNSNAFGFEFLETVAPALRGGAALGRRLPPPTVIQDQPEPIDPMG